MFYNETKKINYAILDLSASPFKKSNRMRARSIFFIIWSILVNVGLTQAQLVTKYDSGFKYELSIDPGGIPIPQEKGSYAKRLRIYDLKDNRAVHEQIIYGNKLQETKFQQDSFELLHINFDGIADIRFTNHNQTFTYILSAVDVDKRTIFYQENLLSSIGEFTRDTSSNICSGIFYDGYNETTYTFKGKHFDTLIRFQQSLYKPIIVQELYFLNELGRLTNIENPNKELPKPKLKKEFGDYNFDGNEDFRIQSIENNIEWNYFLFNKINNSYELDTLLSNMQSGFFDWNNNMFTGTISTRINNLTQQIDTYEYLEGKLTIVRRRVCTQKFDNSERSDCVIYELKDGELIFTDFMPGAE